MPRLGLLMGFALVAGGVAVNAQAADILPDYAGYGGLRGSLPQQYDDPLDIEAGLRYWYSKGAQSLTTYGGTYSSEDTSHIIEGQLRIDDRSTSTYLKGQAGYAARIDGTYSNPGSGGTRTMNGGEVGYAGADFGYLPFGGDNIKLGGFVGYQYLTDNPDMGRSGFVTSSGGGDSETNSFDIHELRLGGAARAQFGPFDINAQAAAIPFAHVYGRYGALSINSFSSGGNTYYQGSAGTLEGNLYGASSEVMFGLHPSEHLTLRFGGRAYYLTGDATMSVTARRAGGGGAQDYLANVTDLGFLRYGLLGEITGSF